jgi:hypothetical protein
MTVKAKSKPKAGSESSLYLGEVSYRHIPKPVFSVTDRQHPFYGGKLDNAMDSVPVLRNQSGHFVLRMSEEEKEYIKRGLGITDADLNTGNMYNEYLKKLNIELPKYGLKLDTHDPYDMLRDKILQAYNNIIAPNLSSISHKASYDYVRVSEGERTKEVLEKSDTRKTAYKLLGQLEESRERMIMYLLNDGARVHHQIEDIELRRLVNDTVERNHALFIERYTDPYFNEKGMINMGVIAGIIDYENKSYYYDGLPLAHKGELPNLGNAALFISDKANADIRLAISKKTLEKFNKG